MPLPPPPLPPRDVASNQRLVVERFLSVSDVFVSLPTGSGKYWMLPFASDILRGKEGSIVLVVSPLIALMKDQVQLLVEREVSRPCCMRLIVAPFGPTTRPKGIWQNVGTAESLILDRKILGVRNFFFLFAIFKIFIDTIW